MTPHRCIDARNLRVRAKCKNGTRRDLFVSFRAGNKIFRKGTRWRSREQGDVDGPSRKSPTSLTRHRVRSARAIDASLMHDESIARTNERRVEWNEGYSIVSIPRGNQTQHDSTRERATSLNTFFCVHELDGGGFGRDGRDRDAERCVGERGGEKSDARCGREVFRRR